MTTSRLADLGLVAAPELGGGRRVQVWSPPGSGDMPLPVLYFHDGQNLFRPEDSFLGATWDVPATIDRLAQEGHPALAVGVWNGGARRMAEYSPPLSLGGAGLADRHLDFLERRVKPLVDANFNTLPGPATTGLVGSSLGGLSSLWGFLVRPHTFGLCAALSPSLAFGGHSLWSRARSRAHVAGHRLYLDVGTREVRRRRANPWSRRSPSQHYVDLVVRLGEQLTALQWRRGRDWALVRETGGRHSEPDWARRLPGALRFLLGGQAPLATARARAPRRRRARR